MPQWYRAAPPVVRVIVRVIVRIVRGRVVPPAGDWVTGPDPPRGQIASFDAVSAEVGNG